MLLDGKAYSLKIREEIRKEVDQCSSRKPKLVFILIGENTASKIYIHMKQKACMKVGMLSDILTFPHDISFETLKTAILKLNHDSSVDGILIQLPLPPHLDPLKVTELVDPQKDVDGFHPLNLGNLLAGSMTHFIPCTPKGILELLKYYRIPTEGKRVVILGRSLIVGKPLAALLMQKQPYANATVTLAHSYSKDIPSITREADILISAMGNPLSIDPSMVKEGVVAIDVGITKVNGKICGDMQFEALQKKAAAITPVPGGIGPMTIAMVLKNTLEAYSLRL